MPLHCECVPEFLFSPLQVSEWRSIFQKVPAHACVPLVVGYG